MSAPADILVVDDTPANVKLVGDLLAGAPLQLASLAGYSPIVAGRFVGFGNLAFAIFGTAMLLYFFFSLVSAWGIGKLEERTNRGFAAFGGATR